MTELTARQVVPITDDERGVLHREAARTGLTHGLMARVFLLHGLDHKDDPEMLVRIEQERSATTERIRAGARAAAWARWGDKSTDMETKEQES